jgi:excisionase family DNA binding protein
MLEPISISPKQAAALLGVSIRTIWREIAAGRIVARRLRGRVLVDRASLEAYFSGLERVA